MKVYEYGKPGRYALLTVSDTGEGMEKNIQEKIFEPFFTTKEVGKGTGLGLAMAYGIVKQHNGFINVYSEPRKGTTFKMYFPLIDSAIEHDREAETSSEVKGTGTILVAEDDMMVRKLIKEILEEAGYEVLEASDGEEALREFQSNQDEIQMLLLDVIMPKKNGKEVYEAVRTTRPDIRAIFISGYDADIIHKKGIIEEGIEFVTKPIASDKLLTKIRAKLA
jgi:hypothetical protein